MYITKGTPSPCYNIIMFTKENRYWHNKIMFTKGNWYWHNIIMFTKGNLCRYNILMFLSSTNITVWYSHLFLVLGIWRRQRKPRPVSRFSRRADRATGTGRDSQVVGVELEPFWYFAPKESSFRGKAEIVVVPWEIDFLFQHFSHPRPRLPRPRRSSSSSAPLRPTFARQGKRAEEAVTISHQCADGHGFPSAAGGIQWEPAEGRWIIFAVRLPALHPLHRPRRVVTPVLSPHASASFRFRKAPQVIWFKSFASEEPQNVVLIMKRRKGFDVRLDNLPRRRHFAWGEIGTKRWETS